MKENLFDNLPLDQDDYRLDKIAKQLLKETEINNYDTARRLADTIYNMSIADLSKNIEIEFKENNIIDVKIIATKSMQFLNIPITIAPTGTNFD